MRMLIERTIFILLVLVIGSQAALAQSQQYPGKYIIASFALPGSGELLMHNRVKGEVFLWLDAAIWATYGSMSMIGNSRNQSAKLYAARYSGASPSERKDEYYTALERYDNTNLYNEDIRRDARELYPDRPDQQKAYVASHSFGNDIAWNWHADTSLRYSYWRLRKASRNLLHTAGFVLGSAMVNRLASALDVAFFSRIPESRVGLAPASDRLGLAFSYRF